MILCDSDDPIQFREAKVFLDFRNLRQAFQHSSCSKSEPGAESDSLFGLCEKHQQ